MAKRGTVGGGARHGKTRDSWWWSAAKRGMAGAAVLVCNLARDMV